MELSFRGKVSPCNLCCAAPFGTFGTKQGNEKLAFPFLWNSKPEALKRKSLLNTFADIIL